MADAREIDDFKWKGLIDPDIWVRFNHVHNVSVGDVINAQLIKTLQSQSPQKHEGSGSMTPQETRGADVECDHKNRTNYLHSLNICRDCQKFFLD